MRCLLLIAALASLSTASAQAPDLQTHRLEHSSLEVTLPAGFALNQALEKDGLLAHGVYLFVDEAAGQTLAVEVHPYLASWYGWWSRRGFVRGDWAERDLAHLNAVPTETAGLPLHASAAYRVTDPENGFEGLALYGCDDDRCYVARTTAPVTGFASGGAEHVALLRGVRFGE